MKLIIDIPVKVHENAQNSLLCGTTVLVDAIKNGIPLDNIRDEIEESITDYILDEEDTNTAIRMGNVMTKVFEIIDKYRKGEQE